MGETLLLVDGEPAKIEPLVGWFEDHGYSVNLCSTGFDALNFIDMEESIDAVVTEAELDQGPGAREIAKSAREHFPNAAIVVLTNKDTDVEAISGAPYDRVVRKPIEPAALAKLLSRPKRRRRYSAASASSASRSAC